MHVVIDKGHTYTYVLTTLMQHSNGHTYVRTTCTMITSVSCMLGLVRAADKGYTHMYVYTVYTLYTDNTSNGHTYVRTYVLTWTMITRMFLNIQIKLLRMHIFHQSC